MYKLLIADDEPNIRALVRKFALHEGYETAEAADGAEAVELSARESFDVIILDVMMPGMDGFTACREIRAHSKAPIIMLTALGEEYDRIRGFELGADDYVVKPFSPRELMLRVAALIKRTQGGDAHELYSCGGLAVDYTARTVSVDGARVDLSLKESELLFYMIKNRGIALTRDRLLSEVWGYDYYGDDRTLDTHIKLLRRKLGQYGGCIVTIRGVGYRFEAPAKA